MIAVDPSDMDAATFASRPAFLVVYSTERPPPVVTPGGSFYGPHCLFQIPENEVVHHGII